MKIIIHAKNIDLNHSIDTFINDKVGSISRFIRESQEASAEARVEVGRGSKHHRHGEVFYAKIDLKIENMKVRQS